MDDMEDIVGLELMDALQEKMWTRGDPDDDDGFEHYRVLKCQPVPYSDTEHKVFLVDDEGETIPALLLDVIPGVKALNGINHVYVKLTEDHYIEGIICEDDCVVRVTAFVCNGDS